MTIKRELTEHIAAPDGNQLRILVPEGSDGISHDYLIEWHRPDGRRQFAEIRFHKDDGTHPNTNGVTDEALLAILIDRLTCIQIAATSNALHASALAHLRSALDCLHEATRQVQARSKESS
jgi:hypothetical protein